MQWILSSTYISAGIAIRRRQKERASQNQNTEIILLGIVLKTAKKSIYSNRMLKYVTREVEQLKNVFLK